MKSCFKLRFQKLIGLGKNPKKDGPGPIGPWIPGSDLCSSVSFDFIGEFRNTDWPSLASDFAVAQVFSDECAHGSLKIFLDRFLGVNRK